MNNLPDWIKSTAHITSSPEYTEKQCCKSCSFILKTEEGDHETPTLKYCDNLSCDLFESNV